MASELSLQVGQVAESVTANVSDAQVGEMLRRFAYATGALPGATPAQLARHVLRELIRYMKEVAQQHKRAEAAEGADTSDIGF